MDRDALALVPEALTLVPEALTLVPEATPQPEAIPQLEAMPQPGPPSSPHAGGSFRALHSKPFRIYFVGQVASASGTFLQQTAIGWLVLQLTGSPASLGIVLAVGGIPSLLLGPFGGSLADRVDLRKLLLATQAGYGALAGALWVVAATGHATLSLIITINVVAGFVQIVDSPARQAFVSSLVQPADLTSAVSLNGVVMNSARVVGPALAGVLIVTVGTTACFAVNAVSYVAVIIALAVLRPLGAQHSHPHVPGGVRAGLRYVRGRQQLWLPLVMMAIVGLLGFNFGVILPVLARTTFHGSGGTYGLLSTMLSVGSVLGSLGVGRVRHPRRPYLMAAAFAFAICLGATAAAPDVPIACVALLVTGVAAFSFVTLCSTTLQLHSAPEYRGRVMALWVFVYIGTTPIGSVVTGWISSGPGPRVALVVGSGACLVAAAIASRVHTPTDPDAILTDIG